MKFRIRSVSMSCSTTSSRNGRLKIVEIELSSTSWPVARRASALITTRTSTAASAATAALATVRVENRSSRNMNSENITRKWNRSASGAPSSAEVLAQLVVAEGRREQQERGQQHRAEAQRVSRHPP